MFTSLRVARDAERLGRAREDGAAPSGDARERALRRHVYEYRT